MPLATIFFTVNYTIEFILIVNGAESVLKITRDLDKQYDKEFKK